MKFNNDPNGKEFDVISDIYIGEAKPSMNSFGSSERMQAKRAFEAAKETNKEVYYHFNGPVGDSVVRQLNEYSERYGIKVTIDTNTF